MLIVINYLIILTLFFKSIKMMNTYKSIYSKLKVSINPNYNKLRLLMNGNSRNKSRDGMGKAKGYVDSNLRYIMEKETESGLPYKSLTNDITNTIKPYIVLGIESSCDDTGVAIVRSDGTILSNIVHSQQQIHEKFGGIVPGLAMKAHQDNIDLAVEQAIAAAGLHSLADIDAVAVTKGPGLEICLRVGFRKAQAIAKEYQKPFVAVHHLEAHCMITRLAGEVIQAVVPVEIDRNNSSSSSTISTSLSPTTIQEMNEFQPRVEFPFLVLLASGGHTSILICHNMGEYTVLGGTLDDALGEAFDKAARLLGLKGSSSGGAAVEKMAASYTNNVLSSSRTTTTTTTTPTTEAAAMKNNPNNPLECSGMSVPMRDKATCDFSYAGLKNSFRLAVQKARIASGFTEGLVDSTNAPARQMEEAPTELVTLPDEVAAKLCYDFQNIAFTHVEDRIKRALDYIDKHNIQVNALVVVGGVAANQELRKRLLSLLAQREIKIEKDNYYFNLKSIKNESTITTSTAANNSNNNNNSNNMTININESDSINNVVAATTTTTNNNDTNKDATTTTNKSFSSKNIKLIFPPTQLCTDNGVMIAWTGIEKFNMGISNRIDSQDDVIPRWPLGKLLQNNIIK